MDISKKYSVKILLYIIVLYLIFSYFVNLNKTESLFVSFLIIISISVIENIIYLNDNILDCKSCKISDSKEKYENILTFPNNSIVNDNNTDNNTETKFNNFIDKQTKENEKIITNYITTNSDKDYMNDYVQYQKDGRELADTESALRENIWRASIGNQDVVQPFLKNAKTYYKNILTRGVNNSPPDQLLKNYMESAEYNYIVPLNEGMVNPEYTFVSPSNWNFLNFTPPVCVIDKDKKSTVFPTITRDDHMPFASLQEFDRSTRFTGNMQINTDYIKNVLNNPVV